MLSCHYFCPEGCPLLFVSQSPCQHCSVGQRDHETLICRHPFTVSPTCSFLTQAYISKNIFLLCKLLSLQCSVQWLARTFSWASWRGLSDQSPRLHVSNKDFLSGQGLKPQQYEVHMVRFLGRSCHLWGIILEENGPLNGGIFYKSDTSFWHKKKKIENFPCLALQQMTQIAQPHAPPSGGLYGMMMKHRDARGRITDSDFCFPTFDRCIWIRNIIISQGFIHLICKMLIIFPNSSNCSKHGVSCFIRGKYTRYFFSNNVNICKIILMLGDGSYWQNQVFSLPILFLSLVWMTYEVYKHGLREPCPAVWVAI